MSGKKKIVIQSKEELDKDCLNEINKELKEKINTTNHLTEQEKEVLLNASKSIENEDISFYNKTINPKAGQRALIKDISENNIDLIISKDAKTFSKIGNEPAVPGIIAEKCSVYTLDGKINTISPEKKLEMKLINTMNINYKKEADMRSMLGEKLNIKDVSVWNLERLTENEIKNIQKQIDKKLKKCTNRKKLVFLIS